MATELLDCHLAEGRGERVDRLEARGIKLSPGAKVVAALTTAQKKAVTVRFGVK